MKKIFVWREGVIRSLPFWTAAAIAALLFSGCAGVKPNPEFSEYYEPIIMLSARSQSAKITDADEATLRLQGYYMVGELTTKLHYSTDRDILMHDFLHKASQHGGDVVQAAKVENITDDITSGGGERWVNRYTAAPRMGGKEYRTGAWKEKTEPTTRTYKGISITSTVWRYDPQRRDWMKLSDPEILVRAAQFGQIELVRFLLEKGIPVDTVNKSKIRGWHQKTTALYQAALNKHTTLVKILLDHGANVNAGEYVPLRGAVKGCDAKIVALLIARGANGNWVEPDDDKRSLLMMSCYDVSIIKMLVNAGAKVNYADKDGRTVLHRVASDSSGYCGPSFVIPIPLEAVKTLLELGADKNVKDRFGKTACNLARYSSRDIRSLLCK